MTGSGEPVEEFRSGGGRYVEFTRDVLRGAGLSPTPTRDDNLQSAHVVLTHGHVASGSIAHRIV
jgi:hypothetical protein